jgi:hypothetical protein
MPEPHPNNPYARPINATRPDAKLVGEYYGSQSTDKRRSHETGNREVSPANRFQSSVTAVPAWPDEAPAPTKRKRAPRATPSPEPTSPSTDATSPTDANAGVITEDDLFG